MLSQDSAKTTHAGNTLKDDVVPGLQLRVFANRRSFYLYYRLRGQQRKPKIGDFPTLSITAARRIAKEMLEKVAAGQDPSIDRQADRAAPTVAELCDRYLKSHADKKKSARSRGEDKRMVESYIKPKLGKMKVSDVKAIDVDDLHGKMEATPYQANRVRALLSKMFNLAEKWELRPLNSNPTRHVTRFEEKKRRRYASREEATAIVERLRFYESQYPQQAAFLWLLVYTGARPDEIARIEPRHRQGAKLILGEHKTDHTGDDRVIHLPPQAVALLDKLPETSGTLLGIKSPRHLWTKILKDTKIKSLRRYDLRHTFASIGLSSGKSLAQIGELLGHRSTETTKRYAHLIDEQAQTDAGQIADAFDAFSKPKLKVVK